MLIHRKIQSNFLFSIRTELKKSQNNTANNNRKMKKSSHASKVKKNKSRKNSHMSATSSDHHDMDVGSPNGSVSRSKNPSPIPGHNYRIYERYEPMNFMLFLFLLSLRSECFLFLLFFPLVFFCSYKFWLILKIFWKCLIPTICLRHLDCIQSDVTTKTLTTSTTLWSQALYLHASKSSPTKRSQRRSKCAQFHPLILRVFFLVLSLQFFPLKFFEILFK